MSVNTEAVVQGNPNPAKFQTLVKSLLGNATHVGSTRGFDLNMMQGSPHSTTTLPYEIYGSAKVVSQTVGTWLASFKDPIRAILGTGIHSQQKIIIKRKYVVGVAAQITPERAPARTVSIQEDVREVELDRYGGDIEMNLNQFLVPGAAEEELNMKVDAQKLELERTLCNLGYDMLMQQGTNLVDAIMRSSPAHLSDSATAVNVARRIARTEVFGAMNKFEYPIINLLAACRYASAYSVGTQRGSVMLLPHGIPDILRYSTPQEMHYKLTGVKSGDKHKPLTMQLDDGYVDNATAVKILVKHPNPRYENGAAHPEVYSDLEDGAGGAGLVRKTYVASNHPVTLAGATTAANVRVVDLESGTIINPFGNAGVVGDEYSPQEGCSAGATHRPITPTARQAALGVIQLIADYPNRGVFAVENVKKWGFPTAAAITHMVGTNDAVGGVLGMASDSAQIALMGPITVAHVMNEALGYDKNSDLSVTTCIAPETYVKHMKLVCGEGSWLSQAYDGRGEGTNAETLAFTFLTRKGNAAGGAATTAGPPPTAPFALAEASMIPTEWASCLTAMGFHGISTDANGNNWFNDRQLIAVKFHDRNVSAFAEYLTVPVPSPAAKGNDAAFKDGKSSAWWFRDQEGEQQAGRALKVVQGPASGMACLYLPQAHVNITSGLVNPAGSIEAGVGANNYQVNVPQVLAAGKLANNEGSRKLTQASVAAVVRCTEVITSSAILAAPGSGTGELLVGFPFTSVSTSQADERMRIQLRCYLGAALYQPDNVLVLHDVYIEGVKKSEYVVLMASGQLQDASKFLSTGAAYGAGGAAPPAATIEQVAVNTGEFGRFDDPEQFGGLHGPPQHFADHHHDARNKTAMPPNQLKDSQQVAIRHAVNACLNYIDAKDTDGSFKINTVDAMTKDDIAAAENGRDDILLPLLAAYAFVTHVNTLSPYARTIIGGLDQTAVRKADKLVAYFAHVDVHRGHETDITQNIAKITGCGRGVANGATWRSNVA